MSRFFCRTVSFTVFLLHGFLVFPQTKIIIYNSNAVHKENKIFVANLIKSFHSQEFKYEINDETSNINELLKAQGYKIRKQEVSDSVIATACEKFETDYLMRFTLYPQKTIRNVRVSLINGNTFAVEKTKTFTCNNLKNKTEVKKITDDIAANFLNANEENDTIALRRITFPPIRYHFVRNVKHISDFSLFLPRLYLGYASPTNSLTNLDRHLAKIHFLDRHLYTFLFTIFYVFHKYITDILEYYCRRVNSVSITYIA